jgi:hypothetical protein
VSSKYPLVAQTTLQASEAAVDRLQVMLPGLLPLGTAAVGEFDAQQSAPHTDLTGLMLAIAAPACCKLDGCVLIARVCWLDMCSSHVPTIRHG